MQLVHAFQVHIQLLVFKRNEHRPVHTDVGSTVRPYRTGSNFYNGETAECTNWETHDYCVSSTLQHNKLNRMHRKRQIRSDFVETYIKRVCLLIFVNRLLSSRRVDLL